jgi:predicted permease
MKITRWLGTLPLRFKMLFLKSHVEDELEEEFQFHLDRKIEELVERGVSVEEARMTAKKALGLERQKEKCRDVRAGQWLGSLRADVLFGWRQLAKRKVTTTAAVLSLGLAIGACMAAFLLVNALFLRPLPVSDPANLYVVTYEGLNGLGKAAKWDGTSYPLFEQMRDAVKGQATLVATGYTRRIDLTYSGYHGMEQAYQQPVSGEFFSSLGLKPFLGRLLMQQDDLVPKAKAVAVLSYDYWMRRFGGDPGVIGHRFRKDEFVYEIVGVAPKGFVGTEPGTMVDVYTPTMMEPSVTEKNDFGMRVFLRPEGGATLAVLTSKLDAIFQRSEKERAKSFDDLPKYLLDGWPNAHVYLKSATGGVSGLQNDYESALVSLSVVVLLVLLIACANVANLISAQAAARSREMALRISIGASRLRLVRMVLVESTMLGLMSAGVGMLFALWAAPFVVKHIGSPSDPVRLVLQPNWMVAGFGLALAMGVTLLFGLGPALRASSVQPVNALKGGEAALGHRRTMYVLIAAQVAFCFVVLFVAGLFVMTFQKLMQRPLGFVPERVLLLFVEAQPRQLPNRWDALVEEIRRMPGVTSAGMSDRAIAGGSSENDSVTVNGVSDKALLSYFLNVSPGWVGTMRIPLIAGRDVRDTDLHDTSALVNETFVKTYYDGHNPVGRTFTLLGSKVPITIVGVVGDAVYKGLRQETLPQVYQPMRTSDEKGGLKNERFAMIAVRTDSDRPMMLAETLRRTIVQTDPVFRVSSARTQEELVGALTIRERMLAALAGFFAVMALLLAAVGLYGVLHYSVLQREREIGIRIALGAALGNIARLVTTRVLAMVLVGAIAGAALGMGLVRYVETLLYGVKGYDPVMLVLPIFVLLGVALLAALPAVARAARIDPAIMLRAE